MYIYMAYGFKWAVLKQVIKYYTNHKKIVCVLIVRFNGFVLWDYNSNLLWRII